MALLPVGLPQVDGALAHFNVRMAPFLHAYWQEQNPSL
jgi:hypothetical protein